MGPCLFAQLALILDAYALRCRSRFLIIGIALQIGVLWTGPKNAHPERGNLTEPAIMPHFGSNTAKVPHVS